MNNEPSLLFRPLDAPEQEGDGWEVPGEDEAPAVVDNGWGDVPTIKAEPELDTIVPDEISQVSEVLPDISHPIKDITPKSQRKEIKESPRQAKAFQFWVELHQEGKKSAAEIDVLTSEHVGISLAAIRQWKTNCEWVKRRVAEVGDQAKEKILSICSGLEKIESASIEIILKYLEQLMKSSYTLDRPTIKLMEELIDFSRKNLDEFNARLFEKRVSSITAGVSLTIRKD